MKLKRPSIFSIVIIAAILVIIIALVIMIVSTITSGKGTIDEDIDKVDSISGNKNISVDEDGNKINISNDMLRKRESDGFVFDSFDITTKNGVSTIGFEIYNPSEEDRELGKYELKIIDEYGNVIHLGERDCSIQRRNQKVLEETPSTVLNDKLRAKMGEAAIKAVKASKYTNAGTIEFLVDKDKNFYFMEMNTRIQVEHPITEMVTGVDLVKEQIKIASGEKLGLTQKDISFKGHSIECRINAENPEKNFRPCPGKIVDLNLPGGNGVRIDTAVYTGYTISPIYDSMIAKLIVHADTRKAAIAKMKRALEETVIDGIDTNIDFLYKIMEHPKFISGDFDTSFISKELGM